MVEAAGGEAKLSANWVMGDLAGALNKAGLEIGQSPVDAPALGGLLRRIADSTISGKIAKNVFEAMWDGEGDADAIIEARGLKQITDSGAIESLIDAVIAASPEQVEQFRAGKANPAQVNQILREKLKP